MKHHARKLHFIAEVLDPKAEEAARGNGRLRGAEIGVTFKGILLYVRRPAFAEIALSVVDQLREKGGNIQRLSLWLHS